MTKNTKNVCQSSAKRHQFMMYLHYSKEYFLDHKSIHIFDSKENSSEALDYFDKKAIDEQLKLENIWFLDSRVWGTVWRTEVLVGYVVALNFFDDEYQFGLVKSVLAYRKQIILVCARLIIECFVSHLNCYKVQEADIVSLYLINQLLDYHLLPIRALQNISGQVCFIKALYKCINVTNLFGFCFIYKIVSLLEFEGWGPYPSYHR